MKQTLAAIILLSACAAAQNANPSQPTTLFGHTIGETVEQADVVIRPNLDALTRVYCLPNESDEDVSDGASICDYARRRVTELNYFGKVVDDKYFSYVVPKGPRVEAETWLAKKARGEQAVKLKSKLARDQAALSEFETGGLVRSAAGAHHNVLEDELKLAELKLADSNAAVKDSLS